MKSSIYRWFFILNLCLLAACGVQPTSAPTAGITPSPLPSATPTARPTATPLPPTATPTFTPSPSPTPTLPPGPPPAAFTAPGLLAVGWSPDGRYFSFISQTEEDVADTPAVDGLPDSPPGAFSFYDIQTGRACSYPERNVLNLNFRTGWIGWKGDHAYQVLTYAGKLVTLQAPCVDLPYALAGVFEQPVERTLAASRDGKMALLAGENTCWLYDVVKGRAVTLPRCSQLASFSPGNDRLAVAIGSPPNLNLYIYSSPNGVLERLIPWKYSGTDGLLAPEWVSASQFIVQPTDDGPVLVSLEGQPLTEAFPASAFNVKGPFRMTAYGAVERDNGSLHILFHLYGIAFDKAYLYHAENRILEELPYSYVNWFDQNRSLLACNFDPSYICRSYWLRAIDPPASTLAQAPDLAFYLPFQSPDGRLVAATSQVDAEDRIVVVVRSLPGLGVVKAWTGSGNAYYFSWSPGSETLAAVSRPVDRSTGGESALYILQFK